MTVSLTHPDVHTITLELPMSLNDPFEAGALLDAEFYFRQTAESTRPYFDHVSGFADPGGPDEYDLLGVVLYATNGVKPVTKDGDHVTDLSLHARLGERILKSMLGPAAFDNLVGYAESLISEQEVA